MDNELHEPEFRLKDMFFSPLRHWRVTLIFAVILAVLLGGFKGVQVLRTMADADALEAQAGAYEDALKEYETKKALLVQSVDKALSDLEMQQEYLSESILMSLDYRNVYEASVSFYVDTNYQIMPGLSYQNPDKAPQIVAAYQLMLQDGRLYEKAASQAGKDVKYIQELVVVETEEDYLLTVIVQHSDQEQAEALLATIVDQMNGIHEAVADSVGEHNLEILVQHSGFSVDNQLGTLQAEKAKQQKTIEDNIRAYKEELAALQMPENNIASLSSAVKTFIKWGILGFVAGAVLLYGFYCAVFLMSEKVYSGASLSEFCGVRILGTVADDTRKRGRIDRWIRKLEGRIGGNSEANNALLAANVKNYYPESGKLLITGDAADEELAQVVQILTGKLGGVSVACQGGLLRSAEAVEALANSDAVLLVERCGKSRYSRVSSQLDMLKGLNKRVIGCILYE